MAVSLEEIRSIAAVGDLSEERLQHLSRLMVRREFAPGEMIFWEGDDPVGIWFIHHGHVRIVKHSESGRTQTLCIANRGKCFGTCPLFGASSNPANAQAVDEVTLFALPRSVMQQMMQDDPSLAQILLQVYSRRLALLAHLSESLGAWSVATRINDCLLAYADFSQNPPMVELTHEKLADLAGTVREVASRHLSQLAGNDVVRLETGCIRLLDLEALESSCVLVKRV